MKKQIDDELAPIALFVYNRLDKLILTIENLKLNKLADRSQLYVFSDGAKNDFDLEGVNKVRAYLKSISGFKDVFICTREKNVGLASNIISGVSEIIDKYGKIIVLEDDILTSENFLLYMNESLDKYNDKEQVMAISGYVSPFDNVDLPEFYFMPFFDCWGWATWYDRWNLYKRNPVELVESTDLNLIRKINLSGSAPDMWSQVLENYRGRMKTWAIFFHVAICKNDGLVLYPKYSLCQNIGLDGSGTNCDDSKAFDTELVERYDDLNLPDKIMRESIAVSRFIDFNSKRINFGSKIYYFVLRIAFRNSISRTLFMKFFN